MTDFDKWLSHEPEPYCDNCEKVLTDDFYEDVDNDRVYCDLTCRAEDRAQRAEDEIRRSEAAYERSLERFHGGNGPTTQREQYMQAWREKRERSR